ncbi:hypothetical protein PGT21_012765 [Puccinia graminis f. sp. tritici]|uniref:Uncharacterized protein n=1 Tax=Puccinia graminis f. sp. tritici TaxID=56615 RepID=A0A5B0SDW7_PUCGR|nr:hypothetical protein PGT21_012765 [Puccinia graminis f. sp. tritici]KAA1136020.1 hypothetical protein PGTUg99_022101 [Puccinia graminis f. sp. tritici]
MLEDMNYNAHEALIALANGWHQEYFPRWIRMDFFGLWDERVTPQHARVSLTQNSAEMFFE